MGRLVGNLECVLQNRLRDDLHIRQRRSFTGQEASELFVSSRSDFVELEFEDAGPGSHQVDIVERDPVAVLCSLDERFVCTVFLSLTHGNFDESVVRDRLVVLNTSFADVFGWFYAGEEHKEEWDRAVALKHSLAHAERRFVAIPNASAFGLFGVHFALHVVFECLLHAILTECAQEQQLFKVRLFVNLLREASGLRIRFLVPFAPLYRHIGHVLGKITL